MPKSIRTPVVELAEVNYSEHDVIGEIAFRVFYGSSHNERKDAALDALERWTDYFSETEKTVVSVMHMQCTQKTTPSGKTYVEFRFGTYDNEL